MTKDVVLDTHHSRALEHASFTASGSTAIFGLASALRDGDIISHRVVDPIGDISGGIRLHGT